MTVAFKAISTVESPWKQARLIINGKEVQWNGAIVLRRGQENTVSVEAPPSIAKQLYLGLAEDGGLNIGASPAFKNWVDPDDGRFEWTLTPSDGESGHVTLVFLSREVLESWSLPCRVMSLNLWDEVKVLFNEAECDPGGPAYPVRGNHYSVRIQPGAGSPSINLNAVVDWVIQPEGLEVTLKPSPGESQELEAEGASWDLVCGNTRDGKFSMIVYLEDDPEIGLEIALELGNHDLALYLATILKGTAGNRITLTTFSQVLPFRRVPGVAIQWSWRGGVLSTGVTNNLGASSVEVDARQVNGPVSVQTYVRGQPHSVKTVEV